MLAYIDVFWVLSVFCAAMIPMLFLMKKNKPGAAAGGASGRVSCNVSSAQCVRSTAIGRRPACQAQFRDAATQSSRRDATSFDGHGR